MNAMYGRPFRAERTERTIAQPTKIAPKIHVTGASERIADSSSARKEATVTTIEGPTMESARRLFLRRLTSDTTLCTSLPPGSGARERSRFYYRSGIVTDEAIDQVVGEWASRPLVVKTGGRDAHSPTLAVLSVLGLD